MGGFGRETFHIPSCDDHEFSLVIQRLRTEILLAADDLAHGIVSSRLLPPSTINLVLDKFGVPINGLVPSRQVGEKVQKPRCLGQDLLWLREFLDEF
jgi:hypothetical protein